MIIRRSNQPDEEAIMSSVHLHETSDEAAVAEDQFRTIVDTIPTLVWCARPDGSAEFLNRRWLDFTGLSAREALDWGWTAAIHPDDRDRLVQYWRSILASGEPGEIEARMRRFDGEFRWFLFRGSPLRDASGTVVKWCGTNADIDDRRRAEEAARVSEMDFRLILDNIPGLVNTVDAAGDVEFANRQMLEYFGKTLEEVRDWHTVMHPDDLPRIIEGWNEAVEKRQAFYAEQRLLRADGIYRSFYAHTVPVRDENGRVIRWYNLLTDIEDRKRAEEAARASQLDFRLVLDSIPGLVATNTATGEAELINRQMLEYFGKTLEDLKGWRTTDAVHPDDLARVVATIGAWMEADGSGGPYELDLRLRRADGVYRWFYLRALPAHDAEGRVVRWYHLLTDIEDRRRAEESMRRTEARLSRAMQIATVGELAASIAHEVNQPLAAIVANGHSCLRWLAAQPPNLLKAQEAAERVVRDGKDAGDIVRRVRALFKRAEVEKVPLDVNGVVREVLHLLEGETARRRVIVEADFADLPHVVGDRVQLQHLILNLVINALEAMDRVVDRPRKLTIRSKRRSGHTALIEIHDDGVGLKDPDKAFEAFFTTKENGMGMGLAICRSIVEEHNGELWATSGEGPGTTFSFTLPLRAGGAR